MDELRAQIDALEASLKSQEKLMAAVSQSGDAVSSSIKEALAANKKAIIDQIAHLDMHLEEAAKMLEGTKNASKSNPRTR